MCSNGSFIYAQGCSQVKTKDSSKYYRVVSSQDCEETLAGMAEGRSSFSNLSLPRGLMTRSGFPPDPNQRLPSFKNSLTKSSLIFQTNPSLVRSPIKPNLTSKSQERTKIGKNNTNGVNKVDILKQTPPRNTNAKLRRPSRQGNKYKPKKLVQLESAVFTGVPLK